MKKSPYLHKRPDSPNWWFRIWIAADVFPRCLEWKHRAGHYITFSLRTDSLAKANPMALAYAERYQALFEEERARLGEPLPVNTDLAVQLKPIITNVTHWSMLHFDDEVHREGLSASPGLRRFLGRDFPAGHATSERVAQAYHDAIDRATGRMTLLEHPVQEKFARVVLEWALENYNLSCPEESSLYTELLEHAQVALLGAFRKLQVRCNGFEVPTPYAAEDAAADLINESGRHSDFSSVPPVLGAEPPAAGRPLPSCGAASTGVPECSSSVGVAPISVSAGSVLGAVPSVTLTEEMLFNRWLLATAKTGNNQRKIDQRKGVGMEVVAVAPPRKRNPQTVREFRSIYHRYWAFAEARKLSPLTDGTAELYVDELLQQVSGATTVKHIGAIQAIFSASKKLVPVNPCAGLSESIVVEPPTRRPFTEDEVKLFFSTPLFLQRKLPEDARAGGWAAYWIPILMFLLGCREEELAALWVAEVAFTKGLHPFPYLDFTKVKNTASRRSVPVPPDALRLGFMEYVGTLESDGRLFPLLKETAEGKISARFSKWANEAYLRGEVGIVDPDVVLYSFRHTFIDACRDADVSKDLAKSICGHAFDERKSKEDARKDQASEHEKYGKGYSLEKKLACLAQLNRKGFPL